MSQLAEDKAVVERLTEVCNLINVVLEVQVTDDAYPGFNIFEERYISDRRQQLARVSAWKDRMGERQRVERAESQVVTKSTRTRKCLLM
ncbi:hypothetical protein BT69DRAFT_1276395 [Atractiella rhizophila]|nr:hypothetical protein BT69DRAFT_1276395 [Atractiella rhizophila]